LGGYPGLKGNPAILITKNPDQLLKELLAYLEKAKKFNIIIHATITGFGGSKIEDPAVIEKFRRDLAEDYQKYDIEN
jgi:hypothetical protein